jgi:hypothetical protein
MSPCFFLDQNGPRVQKERTKEMTRKKIHQKYINSLVCSFCCVYSADWRSTNTVGKNEKMYLEKVKKTKKSCEQSILCK